MGPKVRVTTRCRIGRRKADISRLEQKRKSQPSKSLQNLKNHKLNSAIQQKQSKKASQKAKDQSSRDELNGVTADEELRLALNPQYSLEVRSCSLTSMPPRA